MKEKEQISEVAQGEEIDHELVDNLRLVLDFVERWNKFDAEKSVAIAAENLATRFNIVI